MKKFIVFEWPDGAITDGDTPEEILKKIADAQWEITTPNEVRSVLSDRAWVWGGAAVAPDLPADEFLRQLAAARMFRVVQWNEKGEG